MAELTKPGLFGRLSHSKTHAAKVKQLKQSRLGHKCPLETYNQEETPVSVYVEKGDSSSEEKKRRGSLITILLSARRRKSKR